MRRHVSSKRTAVTVAALIFMVAGVTRFTHPLAARPLTAVAHAMAMDDQNGDPINGRKVFMRANCYTCHGGRAGGAMCPSLRRDKPDFDDVEKAVLNGTPPGMPSFRGFVTQQEIADLAAYIQSLRTAAEPTFTHWWEPGVPTQ